MYCDINNKPMFSFQTVHSVKHSYLRLALMSVLTAFPERRDEICEVLLSKRRQALDEINFPGIRRLFLLMSCIILCGQPVQ